MPTHAHRMPDKSDEIAARISITNSQRNTLLSRSGLSCLAYSVNVQWNKDPYFRAPPSHLHHEGFPSQLGNFLPQVITTARALRISSRLPNRSSDVPNKTKR